jgi:UDP-glucose 6-dehydrogenase
MSQPPCAGARCWKSLRRLSPPSKVGGVGTGMNICLIGTGYVGLVTGTCLAFLGHRVTCVDVDAKKIEMLQSGHSPIYEPGIEELLADGLESSRLLFTTDLDTALVQAEVVFIAVGWREFHELPLRRLKRRMAGSVLIDGRNIFDPLDAEEAGFQYLGIGR